MSRSAKLFLTCAVGAAVVLGTTLRRDAMRTALTERRYEELYYLPDDTALLALSLGHREALADLIWLRALVYTGEAYANRGAHKHVFRYADAMLALDPEFRTVYTWIGTVGIYRVHAASRADFDRTIAFLERGARTFPNDGRLAWDLGATLAYELAPLLPPGPDKTRVLERASTYLERAAELGGGPPWLAMSNAALLVRAGRTERAITHLLAMYAITRDPTERAAIEQRIAALRAEAALESARHELDAFEAERRRTFPYLDPDLFLLVRPRVRAREDAPSAP